MTNTGSYYHPTFAPIPEDAIMNVRECMATMDLDAAVSVVAGQWGNIDPVALRSEVEGEGTPGCKRWGHHFNPSTHHCNRCATLEPVDTTRVLTKHGYKARRVTPAQEAAIDTFADDVFEHPIVEVDVWNESFNNVAIVVCTDGEDRFPVFMVAPDGTAGRLPKANN